tara:strand:+ start:663 stop:998 length:336 start_codon:yes stop_codon:yes gene_type:complete
VSFVKTHIAWIVSAILLSIVGYQYFNKPEPFDDKKLKLEQAIEELNQQITKQEIHIKEMSVTRDSLETKLSRKKEDDKKVIHEKFEKTRADILLLSDDESVKLFAENLTGK